MVCLPSGHAVQAMSGQQGGHKTALGTKLTIATRSRRSFALLPLHRQQHADQDSWGQAGGGPCKFSRRNRKSWARSPWPNKKAPGCSDSPTMITLTLTLTQSNSSLHQRYHAAHLYHHPGPGPAGEHSECNDASLSALIRAQLPNLTHTSYLSLQVQAAGSLRGTDRSRRLAETDGAPFAAADAAAVDLSSQAGSNPWETGGRRDLGACDKCNVAVCQGGCKCDSNCDCRPGLGGQMRCIGPWARRLPSLVAMP